jgi:hypothetical protein
MPVRAAEWIATDMRAAWSFLSSRCAFGMAFLLVMVLVTSCGGGDGEAVDSLSVGASDVAALDIDATNDTPDFVNDRSLERYLLRDASEVPARFVEIDRDDRQPILSLGRVVEAARANYVSGTTREQLSVDVLRIEPDVDLIAFFAAFTEALVGDPNFRDLRRIGVVRGVGESARRFAFTIEGDDADAGALLRGDVVVLLLYRRPAELRQALDISNLLLTVDLMIQLDVQSVEVG